MSPLLPARSLTPDTPATADELSSVTGSTVRNGITRIERLTPRVDASAVDALVGWVEAPRRWESTASLPFWAHVLSLLVRYARPAQVARFRDLPRDPYPSNNQQALYRMLEVCVDLVERRASPSPRGADASGKIPTAKAKLHAYLLDRIGDPTWEPGKALMQAASKVKFRIASEEGMSLFAALLMHGSTDAMHTLAPRAITEPLYAQLLLAHGVPVEDAEAKQATLLAAIAADPVGDEPRAVFADWLLERGDPRGPFIQAMLAGDHSGFVQNDRQALAWAGPIGELMRVDKVPEDLDSMRRAPRFERGMLASACVQALDGTSCDAPHWATVQVLDVMKSAAAIDQYHLPRLLGLGSLNAKDVEAVLASSAGPRLIAIGIDTVPKKLVPKLWDLLLGFENLELLAIDRWFEVEALAEHPLLDRIEVLVPPQHYRGNAYIDRVFERTSSVVDAWPYDRGTLLPLYDRILALAGPVQA